MKENNKTIKKSLLNLCKLLVRDTISACLKRKGIQIFWLGKNKILKKMLQAKTFKSSL